MKYAKSLLVLAATYLLVQGLGLWIANGGFWVEEGAVDVIRENPEMGAVRDPSSPESSGQIFLYVIAATAVLLLLIKFRLASLIKVFINFALLGGLVITLGYLLDWVGVVCAFVLWILRLLRPENMSLMNLVLVFTLPGIGSWLGASLDMFPALLLLLGLAVYDIIAVFGTKHMVTLADNAEKGKGSVPLMFAIPMGERTLGLGTGDLALPLVFAVSLLREYSLDHSFFAVGGGLIGLLVLVIYITTKKDVVLPALPPIAAGSLLGFAASTMLL